MEVADPTLLQSACSSSRLRAAMEIGLLCMTMAHNVEHGMRVAPTVGRATGGLASHLAKRQAGPDGLMALAVASQKEIQRTLDRLTYPEPQLPVDGCRLRNVSKP